MYSVHSALFFMDNVCTYVHIIIEIPCTVNPQNYKGVNFHGSAQYSYYASKTFTVWWLKSKSAMLLINFHTCNFQVIREGQILANISGFMVRERFWGRNVLLSSWFYENC